MSTSNLASDGGNVAEEESSRSVNCPSDQSILQPQYEVNEVNLSIEFWKQKAMEFGVLGRPKNIVSTLQKDFYNRLSSWLETKEDRAQLESIFFENTTNRYNAQNITAWIEIAKENSLLGLSPTELAKKAPEFHRAFQLWTRSQPNTIALRKQLLEYKGITYSHCRTFEEWKSEAEQLGVCYLPATIVSKLHLAFCRAYYNWSKTQPNFKELRRKLFPLEDNYFLSLTTIEAWIKAATQWKLVGLPLQDLIEENSKFLEKFYDWAATQIDPASLRRRVFDYSFQEYASLSTVEDWQDMAKRKGVYEWKMDKLKKHDPTFYYALYIWAANFPFPYLLKAKVFKTHRAYHHKYVHCKSIDLWKKEAQAAGLHGLTEKEVKKRNPWFYMKFFEWVHTQANQDILCDELFSKEESVPKATFSFESIEEWKEKALEMGVHGLTPKEAINKEFGFYTDFMRWVDSFEQKSEYIKTIFKMRENPKFVTDVAELLRVKCTPHQLRFANKEERKGTLKTHYTNWIHQHHNTKEYLVSPKGWYTCATEAFPNDEILQQLSQAVEGKDTFAYFLLNRKFHLCLKRASQSKIVANFPTFFGLDLAEVGHILEVRKKTSGNWGKPTSQLLMTLILAELDNYAQTINSK